MKFKLVLSALALGVLSACSSPPVVRMDPTYEEAAASKFVSTNRDAAVKLVDGLDTRSLGTGPVLVATIVNVNDMRRAAPLAKTQSAVVLEKLISQFLYNKATEGPEKK